MSEPEETPKTKEVQRMINQIIYLKMKTAFKIMLKDLKQYQEVKTLNKK